MIEKRSSFIRTALAAITLGAQILPTLADSPRTQSAAWPMSPVAPPGAPNIILILLDDVGFGAASAFGGPADTPVFDALAAEGLRYNTFYTTAICSPTRAALLTGRNAHRVNFGVTSGNEQSQPGYNGIWPKSTASIADVLRRNGYSTGAFGKWHNTPNWEASPLGPFDRWPTGLGFDYFYGFMGGEADQWQPILYRNTAIAPPLTLGYHLTTAIADDAIGWLHTHQALAPQKPYLLYFATGGTHAPHQVPKDWVDRYRSHFDQGWDKLREQTFARQKQLGVIPQNALLTPRPTELPAWDSLSNAARRLYTRQMEVYAGFLTQTDHEVGRLIDAARNGPGGDNTLVIYIMGDNGGSAEGGMHGSDHNLPDIFYGLGVDDVAAQLARSDDLGSAKLDNHFAIPWAWAIDTPFQWTKQIASHLGAIRNPMVIAWPGHITDKGTLRQQFTNVADVAPTLYQIVGIAPPASVDGIAQKSIDGISFAASFNSATAATAHRTQYFETFGNRAIYQDGWMASARHNVPWQLTGRDPSIDGDTWELYHLDSDFSQAVDVAAQYPRKLQQLRKVFDREARRNDVLPMITNISLSNDKPSLAAGRRSFVYHTDTAPIPSLSGAPLLMGPHRIVAELAIPDGAVTGAIVANGGRDGGFMLYVQDRHLIYTNNVGGKHWDVIRSAQALPSGKVQVAYDYGADSGAPMGRLLVNDRVVGEASVARIAPPSYLGAFCVGRICGSAVTDDHAAPYAFTGRIESVRVEVGAAVTPGTTTKPNPATN